MQLSEGGSGEVPPAPQHRIQHRGIGAPRPLLTPRCSPDPGGIISPPGCRPPPCSQAGCRGAAAPRSCSPKSLPPAPCSAYQAPAFASPTSQPRGATQIFQAEIFFLFFPLQTLRRGAGMDGQPGGERQMMS